MTRATSIKGQTISFIDAVFFHSYDIARCKIKMNKTAKT